MKITIPSEFISVKKEGMEISAEVDHYPSVSAFGEGGVCLERNVPLTVDHIYIELGNNTLNCEEMKSIIADVNHYCLETEMGEAAIN